MLAYVFHSCIVSSVFLCGFFVIGCYPSISSNGMTYPRGDINLREGSNLVINCTLNENFTGPNNASDIGWDYGESSVRSSYITVLDRRTAQLFIPNVNISNSGNYRCLLKSSKVTLCLNVVTVGTSPPKISESNFRCRSEEWVNLTCRWDVPVNLKDTSWNLYYKLPQGNASCPIHTWNGGTHQCFFNETTYPSYRLAAKFFYFILIGNNSYGYSVSQFKVDHFKNVVPSPPEHFTVVPYGNTGLKLTWSMKREFNNFPVALVFRLAYRSQWDGKWKLLEWRNRTSYILQDLVPYTNYTLSLQCRSELAQPDDRSMRSRPMTREQQTQPAIPDFPLETTDGCFEDINVDMDKRNITIYWKSLPQWQHYGPNFTYVIQTFENGMNASHIQPVVSTLLFAKFYALHKSRNYKFKVSAMNSVGISSRESSIFVDKSVNEPSVPEGFSVLYYYNGIYELFWNHPTKDSSVVNYTAFWCKAHRQILDPCSTPIEWQIVNGSVNVVNITVSDSHNNYRFAVAASGRLASSGMVWSKCMNLYNDALGKIKMLPLKALGSTSVEVTWIVDCLDRSGRIVGFNISYCVYDRSTNSCQSEQPEHVFVPDCTKMSYVLGGLIPYTMYSINIAAMAKSGHGEPCNAQQVMTEEGVPGEPPRNVTVIGVTDLSFTLSWRPTIIPNGIVTRYKVLYRTYVKDYKDYVKVVDVKEYNSVNDNYTVNITDNLLSYTNYSVRVKACTYKGCSADSSPLVVTTVIGVPGQPDAPEVRLLNTTHAMVSWDKPTNPGGPIHKWRLFIMRTIGSTVSNETEDVQSMKLVYRVACEESHETEYKFAVCAINMKNRAQLEGHFSDFATLNACFIGTVFTNLSTAEIFGIVAGGTLILTVIIWFVIWAVRNIRTKFREIERLKVELPKGLMEGTLESYNGFKHKLAPIKESEVFAPSAASMRSYGRHHSVTSEERRSSQDSGDTLHISSSLSSVNDELLYSDKDDHTNKCRYNRNLSGNSSGCSSVIGSVSSAGTTRTHLSSDSGAEVESQAPPSPDVVFFDEASWPLSVANLVSATATPPPTTNAATNCQLRLRSSNNSHRFGEDQLLPEHLGEAGAGESGTNVETTVSALTTLEGKPMLTISVLDAPAGNVGGAPYCKVGSQVVDYLLAKPDAARKNLPTSTNEFIVPDDFPRSRNSEMIGPYSRIDVMRHSKLDKGYVCLGESAPNAAIHDAAQQTVPCDTAEQNSKLKRNRKVSLPMGIVTKINSFPTNDSRADDTKVEPLISYVTVASMESDNGSPATNVLHSGYSKIASPDVFSKGKDLYTVNPDNIVGGTLSPHVGKGYVAVALLDGGHSKDLPIHPPILTDVSDFASLCEGSWERELENSDENVTEEDILSVNVGITPSKGYVTLG